MSAAPSGHGTDRLMDLLADRAVQGLGPSESAELDTLLARHPDVDPDGLDLAAAAADVAMLGAHWSPMPASLRQRVLEAAPVRAAKPSDAPPPLRLVRDADAPRTAPAAPARERRFGAGSIGWLAAAACAVLAVLGWWPRVAPAGRSAAEDLAALERSAADVVHVEWAPGNDPGAGAVKGEVVWSPSRQVGFMVFEGLPRNDPRVEQYQLWIFDAQRDEAAPVHGGVFDACPDAGGRCVVRFEPRLGVSEVTLFAVTVEKPGGVWVSKRERIPVLASLKKA